MVETSRLGERPRESESAEDTLSGCQSTQTDGSSFLERHPDGNIPCEVVINDDVLGKSSWAVIDRTSYIFIISTSMTC